MRLIVIAGLFSSLSAMACPDLAGTYTTCRSLTGNTSGSTDMVITQSTQNKVTTYTVVSTDSETNERETETYRADGKINSSTITDPDSGIAVTMSSVVKCANNALNLNMKVSMSGEQVADMNSSMSKSNKQLTIKMTGTNFGEEINETLICE